MSGATKIRAIIFLSAIAMLSGCVPGTLSVTGGVEGEDPASRVSAAARLPPDYRQMMADYILQHVRYPIRGAEISEPYERYGGVFRGGTFPTVCVVLQRDFLLGRTTGDIWILAVDEGRVIEITHAFDSCSKRTPFTELSPFIGVPR